MKKTAKKSFRIALLLCTVGFVIGIISFFAVGLDVKKLSTVSYETNTYEINEEFDKIAIDVYTADICFLPSSDEKCKVVCYEDEKVKHSVGVQNGTLVIDALDTRKWYEHIGISFEDSDITVYLPQAEYRSLVIRSDTSDVEVPKDFLFENVTLESDTGGAAFEASVSGALKIRSDTGAIKVSAVSAGEIDVRTTTGKISIHSVSVAETVAAGTDTGEILLDTVSCEGITADSSTGEITLKNTVASGSCSVTSDTGDVQLKGFDAPSIVVKTSTGDVAGTLLSEKVFLTKTETGRIDVPKTNTGGTCEITTSTGDIEIEIR